MKWPKSQYIATTLAGGCKTTIPAGFEKHFEGFAQDGVLADNDNGGRKFAERIATTCAPE